MKYVVPAAAIILGIVALGLRSETSLSSPIPQIRSKPLVDGAAIPAKPEPLQPQKELSRVEPERSLPAEPQVRPASRKSDSGSVALERSRENTLFYLQRELELGPEQALLVGRVLYERQMETESYFKELRTARIFSSEEFERKVVEIRERSYRKVGGVLDAAQYQKYSDLLVQGKLGDTVAFDMTPEMVILD